MPEAVTTVLVTKEPLLAPGRDPGRFNADWVDLKLPIVGSSHSSGYRVPFDAAILALREAGKTEAAESWEKQFPNHSSAMILNFPADCCTPIGPA